MTRFATLPVACLILLFSGCATAPHTGEGAAIGGLGGAGVGALAGSALGNTGAGAAIGAGVGALTGAAIGSDMDREDSRNRAMVAAAQARRGTVTVSEILNLAQQRVDDGVIINHIRSHGGMAAPLSAQDLVALKQYGVNPQVVRVMQETPPPVVAAPGVYIADPGPPPPVVVGGVYYGHPGYWGPRHRHCW